MGQQQLHWSQRATPDPGSAPAFRPPAVTTPVFGAAPAAVRRAHLPRARSRRTRVVVAIVVCLVVAAGVAALLVINARNSAAAEKEAKAAAAAQMGIYTDYTTGLSFQVPESWDEIPLDAALAETTGFGFTPSATVAFGSPGVLGSASTTGSFLIFAAQDYPAAAGGIPVKESLNQMARAIEDYGPKGMSVSEKATEFRTSGMDGAHMTFKYSAGSQTVYFRLCLIDSGSTFYMFMFGSDDKSWDKDRYYFDNTMDSFSLAAVY